VGSAGSESTATPTNHVTGDLQNLPITLFENVGGYGDFYQPHVAERHLALLLDNVRRFAAGEPLCNVVNKAEWY